MQIFYNARFKKSYKKLHTNQQKDVDIAVNVVINHPYIGEQKKGDLACLRVYKFKIGKQLALLGYLLTDNNELILTFVDFGPHENFYRDLKKSY